MPIDESDIFLMPAYVSAHDGYYSHKHKKWIDGQQYIGSVSFDLKTGFVDFVNPLEDTCR